MRAIAFLLLGLLALTAARPTCAMPIASPPAMMHAGQKAHEHCPQSRDRTAHHGCAMSACGCVLDLARLTLPVAPSAPRPMLQSAAPAIPLAGVGPAAAIPPPRPIA